MDTQPRAELHIPFSDPKATATPWARARGVLEKAGVFWLSTVRPDGRPHVTPLVAVWVDGSLYFCTGPDEVKAKNLARNARCILTTGCNAFRKGLDVVVEGEVRVVTDEPLLRRLVAIWKRKYDDFWHFEVRDGAFHHEAGKALVFEVAPNKAFAYSRGRMYSATRYRFQANGSRRARRPSRKGATRGIRRAIRGRVERPGTRKGD
jgi:general stress protein 26